MKVSELINEMRVELKDDRDTRWTDDKLLSLLKRAYHRISQLGRRNGIELCKAYEDYEVISGQTVYDLPVDFMVPIALFNGTTRLTHKTLEQFNEIQYALPLSNFIITGNEIWVLGAPTSDSTMRFYYYPEVKAELLKLTSQTPFKGKFDWIVLEYATLRAKNIKENTITADAQFLSDLEQAVLDTYATIDPIITKSRGWM